MFWINGKMTDLTKKDAIHKLVDAKGFLERYSNPHDKWTEAINIGIEAIEIVMAQEEPILDKISAEIEELYSYVEFDEDIKTSFNMVRLEEVQRVLDKYKAENKEQE